MTIARDPIMWSVCLSGREPAESMSTSDRAQLVAVLAGQGWSVVDIAAHTRMTTYTTARIRDRLGLAHAPAVRRAAA